MDRASPLLDQGPITTRLQFGFLLLCMLHGCIFVSHHDASASQHRIATSSAAHLLPELLQETMDLLGLLSSLANGAMHHLSAICLVNTTYSRFCVSFFLLLCVAFILQPMPTCRFNRSPCRLCIGPTSHHGSFSLHKQPTTP